MLPQLWVPLTPEAASRALALPLADSSLAVALKLVVLSAAVVRTVFLLSSRRVTYSVALGARTVASSASPLGANGSLLYSDVDFKVISTRPHQHFLLPFQRASPSNYPQRRTVQTRLAHSMHSAFFPLLKRGPFTLSARTNIQGTAVSRLSQKKSERRNFGLRDRRKSTANGLIKRFLCLGGLLLYFPSWCYIGVGSCRFFFPGDRKEISKAHWAGWLVIQSFFNPEYRTGTHSSNNNNSILDDL